MAAPAMHTIDVPCPETGTFNLALRRPYRRQLRALHALAILNEPCTYRLIMADGAPVPSVQDMEHHAADVQRDLEMLGKPGPLPLNELLELLYAASSHNDRSRIAPALDRLLEYVDRWNGLSPEPVAKLFERLEPSRLVRAVGQTLLAVTRFEDDLLPARQAFLSRFIEDLRARGTPETTIRRLERGLAR